MRNFSKSDFNAPYIMTIMPALGIIVFKQYNRAFKKYCTFLCFIFALGSSIYNVHTEWDVEVRLSGTHVYGWGGGSSM